jgi:hypothetical protein
MSLCPEQFAAAQIVTFHSAACAPTHPAAPVASTIIYESNNVAAKKSNDR